MTSPLQVGRKGLNWAADGGVRFNCLSTVMNPNGEAQLQGQTEGSQAGSNGAEVME